MAWPIAGFKSCNAARHPQASLDPRERIQPSGVGPGKQLGDARRFMPQRGAFFATHQKAGNVRIRRDALEAVVGRVVTGLAIGTEHGCAN